MLRTSVRSSVLLCTTLPRLGFSRTCVGARHTQHTKYHLANPPSCRQAPLKRGDGVAFDRGDPEADEAGGVVYDILDEQGSYSLTAGGGGGGGDDNAPVQPGTRVTVVLGPASAQVRVC